MWKPADADAKEFARQDLARLTKHADAGRMDLIYFDQAGFNLSAKVVYAWQKRGERITVPVTRGTSQNVLGFLWHRCQDFASYVFEGAIDSGVVAACLDDLARQVKKKTVVVLDNAPIHGSAEIEEKRAGWAKQGLHLYYLPAYCPSLNKIEMLWEKIKYDWLSWSAYNSYQHLRQELDSILSQIGSKYRITFA